MNELSKSVLATIIYYDLLDYPLTAFEIWKYLIRSKNKEERSKQVFREKVILLDVVKELGNEELKKCIEQFRGFYFLKDRKFLPPHQNFPCACSYNKQADWRGGLVEQRLERNKISERKFKIIKKTAGLLRFVPFVRMVAVTGRVAMKNAESSSDLDLLIVLKHGRIFIGRTLVTLLIHLLGRRRYADKITNRICLNFFITDKSLKIRPALQDLFSSSEYFFARPVFGEEIFAKFQKANQWIENFRVNFVPDKTVETQCNVETQCIASLPVKIIRGIEERIFNWNWLEKILKRWQTERIAKDPRTHLPGSIIIADDDALIFLPEPQGPKILKKFEEKLKNYLA